MNTKIKLLECVNSIPDEIFSEQTTITVSICANKTSVQYEPGIKYLIGKTIPSNADINANAVLNINE